MLKLNAALKAHNAKDCQRIVEDVLGEMMRQSEFNQAELPYFLDLNRNSQTAIKLIEDKLFMLHS